MTAAAIAAVTTQIDRRLAFLACASARFDLVESGEMTLGEAVDDNFVERFRAVAEIVCACECQMIEDGSAITRTYRHVDNHIGEILAAVLLPRLLTLCYLNFRDTGSLASITKKRSAALQSFRSISCGMSAHISFE